MRLKLRKNPAKKALMKLNKNEKTSGLATNDFGGEQCPLDIDAAHISTQVGVCQWLCIITEPLTE